MATTEPTKTGKPARPGDPRALVRLIQWCLPLLLFAIVASYESWEHLVIHGEPITDLHLASEVLFFGMLGPAAVFLVIAYIRRLLGEQWEARLTLESLNRELETGVADRTAALEQRNAELARANAELRQLDQLKSDFVALVSHELRAPLTVFNGGLEVALQQTTALPESTRRTLQAMACESARLTRYVQTILDLSRMEAGKLRLNLGPVAALPLLRRAAEAVSADGRRPIEWHVPRDLPPLWADETYLEEAMRNLVLNADKYSPPGQPIRIRAQASNDCLCLSVADHGPGIPAELQERVFERFYRGTAQEVSAPGWGLGLYFAHRLIEAQNGAVTLRSPLHGDPAAPGAEFSVTLPIANGSDEAGDD